MIEGTVKIVGGREKKLQHGYPWVQRGEILEVSSGVTPGGSGTPYQLSPRNAWNRHLQSPKSVSCARTHHRRRADRPRVFPAAIGRALRYRQRVVQDTNAMRFCSASRMGCQD